jgi:hypothetical protein
VEGCFVEKTETLQIQAISTTGVQLGWGFQSASLLNFAGLLIGYTLPYYEVGVISIIS